ncbi:MAG: spore maturation protein [Ruminococcus sp.]|nr:spore maturation protein [Ruminococcus sp.]
MALVMPLFAAAIVLFGLIRRVAVFDVFIRGAKEGLQALAGIAPTLIGLLFAVGLLRASGAADALCTFVAPAAERLGFPPEIIPMALLRPVSGSGSTALLLSVFDECGPDSFAGQVASVLAGASETTFYAITLYFGAIRVKHIRHTMLAAIAADLTAWVMSVVTVRLFFF